MLGPVIIGPGSPYSFEFRVRFPGPSDTTMPPTQLSGTILRLGTGSVSSGQVFLAYEKPSVTATTGNLYLSSSSGRLQLTSASLFDGHFYNLSVVKETRTGSISISAFSYEGDDERLATSSLAMSGAAGFPFDSQYTFVRLGDSGSLGEFWGQEARLWSSALTRDELIAHARHFESYGRVQSFDNRDLLIHWRLNDGLNVDPSGAIYVINSVPDGPVGTGSFQANGFPFTKFLEEYAYIPSIDYGWNQEKVRTFDGSRIDPFEAYHDEKFVSLEFNMYDALNEDISHLMVSYDELTRVIGLPINRYREDYEGLQQMRETYFKRLQGRLSFRAFADMLDFFDSSFSSIVERLLPARASFKGDEMIVESHMLERPKYQYQLRPIVEGRIEVSGSISIADRWGDDFD